MLVPPAGFGIAEEGIYRCSKVETLNLSFLETLNLKTILFIGGQEPSKFFKDFFNRSSIDWSVLRTEDLSSASTISTLDNRRSIKSHLTLSNENDRNMHSNSPTETFMSPNNVAYSNIKDGKMPVENDSMTTSSDNTKSHYNAKPDLPIDTPINATTAGSNYLNINAPAPFILNDSSDLMLIKSTCLKKTFQKLLNSKCYNLLLVDKTSLIVGILRKIQKWNISSILNEYRLYSGKHSSYFAETFLELVDVRIEQDHETLDAENTMVNNFQISPNRPDTIRSDCVIVSEEDLCNPPEVPKRLINMVLEAEQNEQLEILRRSASSIFSKRLNRNDSDLGIFGHKYRLAFNKKDSGNYEYYKSYKSRHQKLKRYQNQKYNTTKNGNNNAEGNEEDDDDDDDVVTLNIPKESLLPSWFIYQRDLWEQDNDPEVHHFYKEYIFV